MARVLIVGCGCRGRALGGRLIGAGHVVRGTTRSERALDAIAAAGIEPVVADPARLATMMPAIDGVSLACWLMGTAAGERDTVAALHGTRLESLLELVVDTHVRGVVYEAATDPQLAARGSAIAERARARFHMPVEVVAAAPGDLDAWLGAMAGAVDAALAA